MRDKSLFPLTRIISNSRYLTTHLLKQIDGGLRKAPPSPVTKTVISQKVSLLSKEGCEKAIHPVLVRESPEKALLIY